MKDSCNKTRKIILPQIGRSEVELLTPELEGAKLHLKECKECRLFFTQQNQLQKFIKDNLPTIKAPASAREEVLKSIAARGNAKRKVRKLFPSKYSSRYWWAAAVITAVIASILLFNPFTEKVTNTDHPIVTESQKSSYQLTEELINDYIRYRLSEQPAEFATNNPGELNSWFSSKLDFNARFSSIDELQLVGGRLCYLFERRVALAFYSQREMQKPEQWVSLFIFKDNHIDLSKMKTVNLKNKTAWYSESKGYELTVWKQNDLLYALVADENSLKLTEKLLERI